jgi:hypothetical protein
MCTYPLERSPSCKCLHTTPTTPTTHLDQHQPQGSTQHPQHIPRVSTSSHQQHQHDTVTDIDSLRLTLTVTVDTPVTTTTHLHNINNRYQYRQQHHPHRYDTTHSGILEPKAFQAALQVRLGSLVFPSEVRTVVCPWFSNILQDPRGTHALSCQHYRIANHNLVARAVHQATLRAGLQASLETLHLVPDSSARPADVRIHNSGSTGAGTSLDISIVNPYNSSYLATAAAATKAGSAVRAREKEKIKKYSKMDIVMADYKPVVVNVFGGWGPEAVKAFKPICAALGARELMGASISKQTKWFYQRISIALQGCIGRSIIKHKEMYYGEENIAGVVIDVEGLEHR